MLIVGLTGGIACGKSTVSKELKNKYNLFVIDADQVAREVVLPGRPAYQKIVDAFKNVPHLINEEDMSLNRAVLGQAVFSDKLKLNILNSIVHPAVKWEIAKQILKAYLSLCSVVILDVPLLFESQLHLVCGLVITVSTTAESQVKRLLERNPELNREDAENRIKSQMSNEERNYKSDIVIDNSKSLQDLHKELQLVVPQIKPRKIWTLLDLFPPIAIASALFTFVIRRITEKFIAARQRKID
ncbi:CAB5 [Candida oxycetoniae]|uniref:CAB5 n=1 Tax=Candida oxycetoniae TaxID=497107 RepID=A0AAI9SXU4_9ASCO|nr:CAB5 [Candida oxycetoniae]KAI3404733.1 CAB5 [Candida oxycetoniae]